MRKLRRGVTNEVAIMVGGRAASSYHDIFESIGALQLKGMVSLGATLESLRLPQSKSRKRLS